MNDPEASEGSWGYEKHPREPWRGTTRLPAGPEFTASPDAASFGALGDGYWCSAKGFEPAAERPLLGTWMQRLDYLLGHVVFSTERLADNAGNQTLVALPRLVTDVWPRMGRKAAPLLPLPVLIRVRHQENQHVIVAANPANTGQAFTAMGLRALSDGRRLEPEDLTLSPESTPLQVWALALDLRVRIEASTVHARSTAAMALGSVSCPQDLGDGADFTGEIPVAELDADLQQFVLGHVLPQVADQIGRRGRPPNPTA